MRIMKEQIVLSLVLILIVFLSGCMGQQPTGKTIAINETIEENKTEQIESQITKLECPASCDDSDKCTKDYCSSVTNYQCRHDKITPCEKNGICEIGENPSLPSSPEEATKPRAIQSVNWNYRLDCPETCDDGNMNSIDFYNFTQQKCEHQFKNVYTPRETVEFFGENRWTEIGILASNAVRDIYNPTKDCNSSSLSQYETLYYKNENYWKVEIRSMCQIGTQFSYEKFLVTIDQDTGNSLNIEKIT